MAKKQKKEKNKNMLFHL